MRRSERVGRGRPALRAGLLALCAALMLCAGTLRAQQMAPAAQLSARAMNIPELPRVILQPMPAYGVAPLTVGFIVQNSNPASGEFVTYRWNFGDGAVSNLPPQAIFHTYMQPGSYVVTVTATTADGYNASGFAGVIVRPRAMQ